MDTWTGGLGRMVLQAEASMSEVLGQQMLGRFAQQTFVGGKRVVLQKLPRLPKKAATTVHRVKVSLYGARPPIWRRLELPSAMTLDLLHEVLQAAFDWDDYHLHVLETVCGELGSPEQDDGCPRRADEATAALAQVAAA